MASLDAAINRLAIALDSLEARLPAALSAARGQTGDAAAAQEIARLRAEREGMMDEIDRLRGEVRALDDLHEDVSARLDSALREVQAVLTE